MMLLFLTELAITMSTFKISYSLSLLNRLGFDCMTHYNQKLLGQLQVMVHLPRMSFLDLLAFLTV